jgi:hypothetical protein
MPQAFQTTAHRLPKGQNARDTIMTPRLPAALSVLILLGACGQSEPRWYNPLSWFGGSQEVAATDLAAQDVGTAADPRPLVAQVLSLSVDAFPGGAVVRATGLPPTQGYWAGDLIRIEGEDPTRITFRFVALAPPEPSRVSTQQSREIVVGTSLSDIELEGVREIIVQGASNARATRR